MPGRSVPLALQVVAQDFVPVVVLRALAGHVLHRHVVERARSAFETHARNLAFRDEQQRRAQPEYPRLEIVTLTSDRYGLRHVLALRKVAAHDRGPHRQGFALVALLRQAHRPGSFGLGSRSAASAFLIRSSVIWSETGGPKPAGSFHSRRMPSKAAAKNLRASPG